MLKHGRRTDSGSQPELHRPGVIVQLETLQIERACFELLLYLIRIDVNAEPRGVKFGQDCAFSLAVRSGDHAHASVRLGHFSAETLSFW